MSIPKKQNKKKKVPAKSRNREESKKALLKAALEVFSERGYDAATTKTIAARAGMSEALIQRYFVSKSGLLLELLRQFQEQDGARCGVLAETATLADTILEFFKDRFADARQKEAFMKIAVSRSILDPQVSRHMSKHIWELRIPPMVEGFKQAVAKGLIDDKEDLEAIAVMISALSFSLGFMGQLVFRFDRTRLERVAQRAAAIIAKGVNTPENGRKHRVSQKEKGRRHASVVDITS